MIPMTERQERILSHVVPSAADWYAHAVKEFGPQMAYDFLVQKCKRLEPEFDRESKLIGYKTRSERDAVERVKESQR